MRCIIFSIFLSVAEYCTDQFWKDLFENLAYGICPYGLFFNSSKLLCCKFKNKEFYYDFHNKTAKEIFLELTSILKTKFFISSRQEQSRQYKNCDKLSLDNVQNWSDIRKKSLQLSLLENYILELQKKHNFSSKICRKILSNILIALQFKVISSNDVVFDSYKNQISTINGLNINEHGIRFENKEMYIDLDVQDYGDIDKISFIQLWRKLVY